MASSPVQFKSVTGTASGTSTAIPAVTGKKIKVFSLSVTTVAVTANTLKFRSGAAGVGGDKATYLLQAPTGVTAGVVDAVQYPGFLFETNVGELLEIFLQAAGSYAYNIRYWDDDAA